MNDHYRPRTGTSMTNDVAENIVLDQAVNEMPYGSFPPGYVVTADDLDALKGLQAGVSRNGELHDISPLIPDSDDSEDSLEHPTEVDRIVQEDMSKLERVFDSMGFKFRMIDRIGEGQ